MRLPVDRYTVRLGRHAALVLVLAAPCVSAQVDATTHELAPAAVEQHKGLDNKVALLNDLVRNSPASQRIEALSGTSRAEELLATARKAAGEATRLLSTGEEAAAERAANDGLRAFSAAARLVVDPQARRRDESRRYEELKARIASFREAFERIAKEKGAAADSLLDRGAVQGFVSSADFAATAGDFEAANRSLVEAAARVEVALTEIRKGETLLDALHFDSPAEEYEYEKRRNQAYVMLLEMLERQGQIPEEQAALVAEMVRQNDTMRADANVQASAGAFPAAIAKLENGTNYLVRALRGSGLPIP